jgi:uncharacterized protein (DUF1697 family)
VGADAVKGGVAFVALLRGVNVGGRNAVSMARLKETFEALGLADVRTYINSGNVLFRWDGTDARLLERRIDRTLEKDHRLASTVVVRSEAEIARVVKAIDTTWKGAPDPQWKYNVMFLRPRVDAPRVLSGIALKPDIEKAVYCPGTLLWSARLSAFNRTAMKKIVGTPLYQEMTIRNVNTTRKILALMREMENGR